MSDTKFKKGNEIGKETRFQAGNQLSSKYKDEYADSLLEFFRTYDGVPTFEKWADENGIDVRTACNWKNDDEKYPRFSANYAQALSLQKAKLIEYGLLDKYNANLTKFLLTNIHGMSEKVEQKVEGDTNATITVEIREVN
jgi:hypothetical protein